MIKEFIIMRINELCSREGIGLYGLSKQSGISYNTLHGIINGKAVPSVYTINDICDFFNISVSQFFSYASETELPDEDSQLLDLWRQLNDKEQSFIMGCIYSFLELIPSPEGNDEIRRIEKNRGNTHKNRRQYTI